MNGTGVGPPSAPRHVYGHQDDGAALVQWEPSAPSGTPIRTSSCYLHALGAEGWDLSALPPWRVPILAVLAQAVRRPVE